MFNRFTADFAADEPAIHHQSEVPPVSMPSGYTGPAWLPGTGRMIFWTGRVAIGLRHEPPRRVEATVQSGGWVQSLMLG